MKSQKTQYSKSLHDQDRVSAPFLIKYSAVATGKTGKPYMNLILTDKTGDVEARIFDQVPKYSAQAVKNTYVHVEGNAQTFQGRIQVLVKELTVLREDEVDSAEFVLPPRHDAKALFAELVRFVDSMQDEHYRSLCRAILVEDPEVAERLMRAPAAKSMHHAYPVGLLEHVVSISKLMDAVAAVYAPQINRDLLLLGGFLHDLCKIWELDYDKATDYTMEGRLVGHLVMGSELIEKTVTAWEQKTGNVFPIEKKLLAKHMVLAHHGKLEYGSPKEPQVLEAQMVHMIDDLDSKVNAIREFVLQDAQPGAWTALNKNFGRYFYKPEWARKHNP